MERRFDDDEVAEILETHYLQGHTVNAIAIRMNSNSSTVRNVTRAYRYKAQYEAFRKKHPHLELPSAANIKSRRRLSDTEIELIADRVVQVLEKRYPQED